MAKIDDVKKEAVRDDAEGVTFDFKGDSFVVKPMNKWSPAAVEALENDKIVTTVHLVLGEAQYRKFLAKAPDMDDFSALSDAVFAALEGLNAGE